MSIPGDGLVLGRPWRTRTSAKIRRARHSQAARRQRRLLIESLEDRSLLAAFTPGNLLVYRIGTGLPPHPTSNMAIAAFLDEVDRSGTVIQTIPVPTADSGANRGLTASSTAESEGLLTLSADGQYALFAGYNAPLGTKGLTNTNSATVPRVIGRVGADGVIDTTTLVTNAFSGGNIRSALSSDGTDIWITGSGSGGGVRHTTFGSDGATTLVSATSTSTRGIAVADGQLYVSTVSGALRIGTVGTGTPTTSGQSIAPLAGIPSGLFGNDPHQFFFADLSPSIAGVDTLYIADDTQGLCKFSLSAGSWVLRGSTKFQGDGFRALTGQISGNTITLFLLTDEMTDSKLVSVTDSASYNQPLSASPTLLFYSAGPARTARGIAFVPEASVAEPGPDILLTTAGGHHDILLRRVENRVVASSAGTTLLDREISLVNSITFQGDADDDTLTVEFNAGGGQPIPPGGLFFHGAGQAAGSSRGDLLRVIGSGLETASYSADVQAALDRDGTLTIDGRTISFTGLEPIDMLGMGVVNVTLPGGADVLTIAGGSTFAGGQEALRLGGTSGGVPFETIALRGNATVNIDTTGIEGAPDLVSISGADNPHGNTNLNLTTGSGAGDRIEVLGAIAVSGSLRLASERIDFPNLASIASAAAVVLEAGGGPIADSSPGAPSVVAIVLSATAASGITLGTDVATLSAVTASAGDINLTAAGPVTLTNVTTAGGTIRISSGGTATIQNIDSGASSTTIAVTGGGLVGSGDAGTADIVAGLLTIDLLTQGSSAGSSAASRLEIDAAELQLTTNGAAQNHAFILDTAGGLRLNDSTVGMVAGSTFDLLIERGSLTSVVDGSRDVAGDLVVLRVTGPASTLGAGLESPLEIDAASLAAATSAGGEIFLRDTDGAFPLGLVDAAGGNVDLLSIAGPLTDANGDSNNIVAAGVSLRAFGGIGDGDALETAAGTLAARNVSPTAGDIAIVNLAAGPLAVDSVNGLAGIVNSAPEGQIRVASASVLAVTANVIAAGDVLLSAGETGLNDVDHLTVEGPGVRVQSTGGTVSLLAGDDLNIGAETSLVAAATIELHVDEGDLDAAGGALAILGTVASGLGTVLSGGAGNDTFALAPQATTRFDIDGESPFGTPTGDTLDLDFTAAIDPLFTPAGVGAGTWSFANCQAVAFQSIEQLLPSPPVEPTDFILDMQLAGLQSPAGDTDEIFVRLDDTGTQLWIDVDGVPLFRGATAAVRSLTIIGSSDDDVLRIDETAGGLPRFAGRTPQVDHGPLGGGSALASHLNDSAARLLDAGSPAGTVWTDDSVTIHFDGQSGNDAIELNLLTRHDVAYTADNLDAENSGNLSAAGSAGPNLLLSFANLAPLSLSGAGGELVVDASANSQNGDNVTLRDDSAPADGWSIVEGTALEATRFRGFDRLVVVGGSGSQSLAQLGLDSNTTLALVTLHGGNTADWLNLAGGDSDDDTIQIESTPPQTAVGAAGDGGNDLFHLFDASGTVDRLLAAVAIEGGAGDNRLVVRDEGDVTGDTILIDQDSIDGITGFGGSGIAFANIDRLELTGTSGSDTLDARFAPGSDLDSVILSGWLGDDQFYLSTSDETASSPAATGIRAIQLYGDAPGNPHPGDGSDIFGEMPADLTAGFTPPPEIRMIRPSRTTRIQIDGGGPEGIALPVGDRAGDVLNLDVTQMGPPLLVSTLGTAAAAGGLVQSIAGPPSHAPIHFAQIEDINLADGGILTGAQMGDLYVRGSDGTDSIQFAATADPNLTRVRVNSFQGYFPVTRRTVVYGRGGNDYLTQGNFNKSAEFYGEGGNDYLAGGVGDDLLVGGAGRDRINASQGNNIVWGDRSPLDAGLPDTQANRQLLAADLPGSQFHPLAETQYADTLSTLDGSDTVYGGPGIDSLTLGGGDDWAHGGQGSDRLAGGSGEDRLYGGDGNDTLSGDAGHDLLGGGEGNDTLYGRTGNDVLIGGAGNDSLIGDTGDDLLLDGNATYGGLNSESRAAGDPSDLALAQLLAEWAALGLGGLTQPLTNDHAGNDLLRGSGGRDTLSAGSTAEILDFSTLDDTLLP
ncbi:MAG: hypothetical protein WD872_22000 [Pirellulaceae bacterium]